LGHSFWCVETETVREVDHTYWNALKRGAGKWWKGLFGLILWWMQKYYKK